MSELAEINSLRKPNDSSRLSCFHCGDLVSKKSTILFEEKNFCCNGCRQVYEILNNNNLCGYYEQSVHPGLKINEETKDRLAYLESKEVETQLIDFTDNTISKITFHIPQIHCSSCIWLLENFHTINSSVLESRVHFIRKELHITYTKQTNLRQIVEELCSIGYEPLINLASKNSDKPKTEDHSLMYKIGVTGFCAGNIMLFSFPEYFGDPMFNGSIFQKWFSYFNFILALPVVLYGANNYFISAFQSLKHKTLSMDVPIALGTGVVFIRSCYEVLTQTGVGYFDSLTGLVLFLLIGQWMQKKTYRSLGFENHYQSYFPLAVQKLDLKGQAKTVLANELEKDDLILIHNQEVIPCDSILLSAQANIDYSFVTGESRIEKMQANSLIYAGGRHIGERIHLKVVKSISASHLTQLWNHDVFKKPGLFISHTLDIIGSRFVIATLLVTLATFLFWQSKNDPRALWAATSVLLVACPCAIALAMPFGLSNAAKWLSKAGFYVKNPLIIEKLSKINHIVFDKTGTLTMSNSHSVDYQGLELTQEERAVVKSMTQNSLHPLSQSLSSFIKEETLLINHFEEVPGKGLKAEYNGEIYLLGSSSWIGVSSPEKTKSCVFISINHEYKGVFTIERSYRTDLLKTIPSLSNHYATEILTGDFESEKPFLSKWFSVKNMHFNKSPQEKLHFIETLKNNGKNVLMIGDGLNDAGALKASDVGISVSDHIYHFSPACDIIAEAKHISNLEDVLRFSKSVMKGLWISFTLSFIYNIVGFYFAFTGQLSPLVAAILMPVSSISVVGIAVFTTHIIGTVYFRKHDTGHVLN